MPTHPDAPRALDPSELRRVFGLFTTGVTVVTGLREGGEPVGVTANSVTSVSLDPPLILWCLANSSSSRSAFALHATFAIHILAAAQADIAMHFARSGGLKFDPRSARAVASAPPSIEGALARIECRVVAVYPGGDHVIIVGSVDGFTMQAGQPLAFHASRFGRFAESEVSSAVDVWRDARDGSIADER